MSDHSAPADDVGGDEDAALQSPRDDPSGSSPPEPAAEASVQGDSHARHAWGPSRAEDVSGTPARVGDAAIPDSDRLGEHRVEGDDPEEVEQIAQVVLQRLEAHLHLPMQTPDGAALAELKRNDPAAHAMWLRQVEKQLEHQRFMESARYTMPLKVMKSAHRSALIALVALVLLTAFALYLDHPWFAGVFGALDVVAVLVVFTGSRDDE